MKNNERRDKKITFNHLTYFSSKEFFLEIFNKINFNIFIGSAQKTFETTCAFVRNDPNNFLQLNKAFTRAQFKI